MSAIFLYPIRLPGSGMSASKRFLSPATWEYVAQFFVGFFFLAAAYHKTVQGFFGAHRTSLGNIFQHWIRNNLPLEFYRDFMLWVMPYADVLGIIVIVAQIIIGLLLILNLRLDLVGLIAFFVQGSIYLATYHHAELRVLGSQAIWFAIFYFCRSEMKGKLWTAMTYVLVFIGLMHLFARFQFGDPWFSAYAWQRQHYIENVMGSSVFIKDAFIFITQGTIGTVIWAGAWWWKLVLMLGILTRHRLLFGALWMVTFFFVEIVWLNAWNCEGAFWAIILFTWITHEYALQRASKTPPTSLLP